MTDIVWTLDDEDDDDDSENEDTQPSRTVGKRARSSISPPPRTKRVRISEADDGSTDNTERITLAEFNTFAARNDHAVKYDHEELSRTPRPLWEAVCRGRFFISPPLPYTHCCISPPTVDNVERGRGEGSSKNSASENAANDAFRNLHWRLDG